MAISACTTQLPIAAVAQLPQVHRDVHAMPWSAFSVIGIPPTMSLNISQTMSFNISSGVSLLGSGATIMSRVHKDKIKINKLDLIESVNLSDILDGLVSAKVVTDKDRQQLEQKARMPEQVELFLEILLRKPDSAYFTFIDCLRKTDQNHVANLLEPTNVNVIQPPGQFISEEVLRLLAQFMECQYGLLVFLESYNVLTSREVCAIQSVCTWCDQNVMLIRMLPSVLQSPENYNNFLRSLNDTGQNHLATLMITTGGVAEWDRDRLLTKIEIRHINGNMPFLVDNIHPEYGLLEELVAVDCLTERHKEAIRKRFDRYKMNEELVDILKRRSFSQYKLFLRCLNKTGQKHIVEVLDSDGVVVAADATLDDSLSTIMVNAYSQISTDERKNKAVQNLLRFAADSQITMVGMAHGHSVRLYFLCSSLKDLCDLRQLHDSEELKSITLSLFNCLLSDTNFGEVHSIHVSLVDYCKCEEYFLEASGFTYKALDQSIPLLLSRSLAEVNRSLVKRRLSPSLWELILFKSFIKQMRIGGTNIIRAVYATLASISAKHRKALFESKKSLRTVIEFEAIKLSCGFLLRNITALVPIMECQFGLLDELHKRNVLTGQQCADIMCDSQKQKESSDDHKIARLLKTMQHITRIKQFEKFLSALGSTGQVHVATFITQNGVVDQEDDNRAITSEEAFRMEIILAYLLHHIDMETVITDLHAINCITDGHKKYLQEPTRTDKPLCDLSKELLRILQRRSFLTYKHFLQYRDSPAPLAEIRSLQPEPMNEAKYYSQRFEKHWTYLEEQLLFTEPLANDLLLRQVLLMQQCQVISQQGNTKKINRKLLEVIVDKKSAFEDFLLSLWRTGQAHLAEYIIYDGRDMLKCELLTQFLGHKSFPVCAVVELLGNIFVAYSKPPVTPAPVANVPKSNVLLVYDSSSFKKLPDIILWTKNKMRVVISDMTSCNKEGCLYIYDVSNSTIWKSPKASPNLKRWLPVESNMYIGTLSTTSKGQVVLPLTDPPRLNIYNGLDAILVQSISLPSFMGYPRHAVETLSHGFVVLSKSDASASIVALVTETGEVLRSCTGKLVGIDGHVAVDRDGHVFVSCGSNLLITLDSILHAYRPVLSSIQANQPFMPVPCSTTCVCYSKGRLFVGNVYGGVDVWMISGRKKNKKQLQ